MSEAAAPRRSARNAGKPATGSSPITKQPAAAATKRKATTNGDADAEDKKDEKKSKPTPSAAATKAASAGALKVGDKLPDLKLKTQDGKELDIGSLKKVVIFS